MFQNLESTIEDIKVQQIIDMAMFKLFDTSKNKDRVNYNLFDAFYMESRPILEANVTIEFDTLSGNDMPTVSVKQDTELNLLQASTGVQNATILAIESGIQFSLKELRSGKVNEAKNIEFTSLNLMRKILELILKGMVTSEFNNKDIKYLSNSLISKSKIVQTAKSWLDPSITNKDIADCFDNAISYVNGLGYDEASCIISNEALRKMGLVGMNAEKNGITAMSYVKDNTQLTLYPTSLYDKVGDFGACMTIMPKNPSASTLLMGVSPQVLSTYQTQKHKIHGIIASFGGVFNTNLNNTNVAYTTSNLLG